MENKFIKNLPTVEVQTGNEAHLNQFVAIVKHGDVVVAKSLITVREIEHNTKTGISRLNLDSRLIDTD